MLAEGARDGGYRPLALDLFGDADTRRAAEAWWPIGAPTALAIDGAALLAALGSIAAAGEACGWIAGGGFEADPALLAAAAGVLPLVGNAPEVFAQVRSPAWFFGRLAALGIAHPTTAFAPPSDPAGWLRKDAGSSGGWHVLPLSAPDRTEDAAAAGRYYQRHAPGEPMSALFLADGRRCRLIGVSRQIVRRLGGRPYVFRGCLGPVGLPPALLRELEALLDALVADMALRGLNGLDFLLDGDTLAVLELNPRPSASMDLYRGALPGGLVRAHVRACVEGYLPARDALGGAGAGVRGFEVVYASRRARLPAPAATPWCHDVPAGDAEVGWGEPICTVSAAAPTEAAAVALLARRRREIRLMMEQIDE